MIWVAARSRGRLGDILAMLGQFPEAEEAYRDAVPRLQSLAEAYPAGALSEGDRAREGLGSDILRDLVRSRLGWAVLLKDLYRLRDAGEQLRQAAASGGGADALTRCDGSRAPGRDRLSAGRPPGEGSRTARLADRASPRRCARARRPTRRPSGCSRPWWRRISLGSSRGRTAGRDLEQQRTALGRFRNNLGKLLDANGRPVEAENEFRGVLELFTDSEKLAGPRWQRARAAHNLGQVLLKRREGVTASEQKARTAGGWSPSRRRKSCSRGSGRSSRKCHSIAKSSPRCTRTWELIEQKKKQYPEAVVDLRRARDLSDQLVAEFPTVPKHRVQSAEIDRLLAANLLGSGRCGAGGRARAPFDRTTDEARRSISRDAQLPGRLTRTRRVATREGPDADESDRRRARGGRAGVGTPSRGTEIQPGEPQVPPEPVG